MKCAGLQGMLPGEFAMKPWLLNVVACPVCRNHPLAVHILEVEANKLVDPEGLAKELVTHYAKGILSETSLGPVHNLTNDATVEEHLAAARTAFSVFSKRKPSSKALQPLVAYFYGLEVIEGVLECEKCGRWYPIGSRINTIPELLPDAGRNRQTDITFLRKHQDTLPANIVSGSKPYGLEAEK